MIIYQHSPRPVVSIKIPKTLTPPWSSPTEELMRGLDGGTGGWRHGVGGWQGKEREDMRVGVYPEASSMDRPKLESQLRQMLVV